MARSIRPYYRKFDGWFYASSVRFQESHGKPRIKLVKGPDDEPTRQLAQEELDRILSRHEATGDSMTVAALLDSYIDHQSRQPNTAEHNEAVARIATNFAAMFGQTKCADFYTHAHRNLDRWLSANPKWASTQSRRRALIVVKSVFNYGRKYLGLNPAKIHSYPIPESQPRITYFTEQQEAAIIEALSLPRFNDAGEFADFFVVALETGGRTFVETASFTKERIEYEQGQPVAFDMGVVKRKARIVYLSKKAASIISRLADRYPTGPLFRNAIGQPWNASTAARRLKAVVRYLMRTKPELGLSDDHTLYACRHTFIVRKLIETKGDIALVAEMAGNTVQVIERHYKKWGTQRRRILAALA